MAPALEVLMYGEKSESHGVLGKVSYNNGFKKMEEIKSSCQYLVYPGRGEDPCHGQTWIRRRGLFARNETVRIPLQNGPFEGGWEHVLRERDERHSYNKVDLVSHQFKHIIPFCHLILLSIL